MAFRRGTGSVEVELARLQSWVENADEDLYGKGEGDVGVIQEHRDTRTQMKTLIWIVGLFGGGIPTILAIVTFIRDLMHGH